MTIASPNPTEPRTVESPLPLRAEPTPTTEAKRQSAYAAVIVILLVALLYRGYGNRLGTHPTEVQTPEIARRIDLNTADRSELRLVPGIGPGLADSIVTLRRERGRFKTIDDLGDVKGVGIKTIEKLRPWLTVEEGDGTGDSHVAASSMLPEEPNVERLERRQTSNKPSTKQVAPVASSGKIRLGDSPIDLAVASESDLIRLPGVGPAMARRILEARESKPFQSINDLRRVRGIGAKTLESLRPYLTLKGTEAISPVK